jgi:hypothetical protein
MGFASFGKLSDVDVAGLPGWRCTSSGYGVILAAHWHWGGIALLSGCEYVEGDKWYLDTWVPFYIAGYIGGEKIWKLGGH